MTDYDAVVIGAGCGGLTAAVTMAQGGLRVMLLEKHNVPGGCAQSFYRGRFEFEASLHQLSGMGSEEKPGRTRNMLQKMGVLQRIELLQESVLYGVKIEGQLDVELPADREQLVAVLQEKFPAEKEQIQEFVDFTYEFIIQSITCTYGLDPEATPEKYPLFFKYALRDTQSIFDEFLPNRQLQICLGSYICYMGLPTRSLPFERLAIVLWSYLEFKPSHFVGGSQALSNALVDCFTEAGGHVKFNRGVEKILLEDGEVAGVVTDDGQQISTRYVISNASAVDTYMRLMEPDQVPQETIEDINSREIAISAFTVYLGLDCEPGELGIKEPCTFMFDKSAGLDDMYGHPDRAPKACLLTCYDNVSAKFSPPGACQMVLVDLQYGEPWQSISANEYTDVKYRYADQMIALAETFYPGIRDRIEEVEISTPVTNMRYLSTPGGSIYGFSPYNKDSPIFSNMASPVKGLSLAGAWVAGGGYEPTLASGVDAGQEVVMQFQDRG